MQVVRRTLIGGALIFGLLLLVVALKSFLPISTPAFIDANGNELPNSIASVERWQINDTEQSVILRGRDRSQPILIWLHGGPGSSETAVLRHFNSPLEDHFVVAYWDQRYAGQSLDPFAPIPHDLTINQYVDDLGVLVNLLRARFQKDKVILLAHSWGTVIGTLYAERNPGKVAAYIGVGQVTNTPENESLSYNFALREARTRQDTEAITRLESIGPPPRSIGSIFTPRDLLARYGGSFHADIGMTQLVLIGMRAPESNWRDMAAFLYASDYSSQMATGEFAQLALDTSHTTFHVPMYFASGRYDHQSEASLAYRYFERIVAPKKEFTWFEHSAHSPNFEEAARFNEWVISRFTDFY